MQVLLVGSNHDLALFLRHAFELKGYGVTTAFDQGTAAAALEKASPDLAVVDMSGYSASTSGLDLLRSIRSRSRVPLLVLAAAYDEEKIGTALEIGADDYLSLPLRPRELMARARALLQAGYERERVLVNQLGRLDLDGMRFDPGRLEVTDANWRVRLTPTEFVLLHYLMTNLGAVLSPSDIMSHVWSRDIKLSEALLDLTLSRLRQKIKGNPADRIEILRVDGLGYQPQVRMIEA